MPKPDNKTRDEPVPFARSADGPVLLDPLALITTRALVTANSGGGKSYVLRKVCELLGRSAPIVVLDMEGEFVTLRERLDLVIVGPGGEIPADVRSSGLLARRLVERSLSAVVDMSEMRMADRRAFVARFCQSLVELPKSLWRPLFVVLDEAHQFCPEKGQGEAESTSAVIDLCTLGRKRSFCPILATQRVSTLHKTAAGECNNKLIGRMSLDTDIKRAAFELGVTPAEAVRMLRDLEAGEFYGFGPALDPSGVTRFRVEPVQTTHPKPGRGKALVPPAPSSAVTAVVAELADLPQQAEAEARDLASALARVGTLERELVAARAGGASDAAAGELAGLSDAHARQTEALRTELRNAMTLIDKLSSADAVLPLDPELVRTAVQAAVDQVLRASERRTAERDAGLRQLRQEAGVAIVRMQQLLDPGHFASPSGGPAGGSTAVGVPRRTTPRQTVAADPAGRAAMSPTERAVLDAAASFPGGATRQRIGIFSGRSIKSSSFQGAFAGGEAKGDRPSLVQRGLLRADGDRYVPTEAGHALAEPTAGVTLADWLGKLLPSEAKVLQCLATARPGRLTRADVAARTGQSEKSSSFQGAFPALRELGLIEGDRDYAASAAFP